MSAFKDDLNLRGGGQHYNMYPSTRRVFFLTTLNRYDGGITPPVSVLWTWLPRLASAHSGRHYQFLLQEDSNAGHWKERRELTDKDGYGTAQHKKEL